MVEVTDAMVEGFVQEFYGHGSPAVVGAFVRGRIKEALQAALAHREGEGVKRAQTFSRRGEQYAALAEKHSNDFTDTKGSCAYWTQKAANCFVVAQAIRALAGDEPQHGSKSNG